MKIMNKSQWKKIATMLLMVSMFSMNTMTQDQPTTEEAMSTGSKIGLLAISGLAIAAITYFGYKHFAKTDFEAEKKKLDAEEETINQKPDGEEKNKALEELKKKQDEYNKKLEEELKKVASIKDESEKKKREEAINKLKISRSQGQAIGSVEIRGKQKAGALAQPVAAPVVPQQSVANAAAVNAQTA